MLTTYINVAGDDDDDDYEFFFVKPLRLMAPTLHTHGKKFSQQSYSKSETFSLICIM